MIWIAHKRVTTSDVFRAATMLWGISKSEVTSKCRKDGLVKMRWIMFASLRMRGVRYDQIGKAFSLDGATILHGLKQHDKQTCSEYIENSDALSDLHDQLLRGADPFSCYTSNDSYRDNPNLVYGRVDCPNMGGFSDYDKANLSFN